MNGTKNDTLYFLTCPTDWFLGIEFIDQEIGLISIFANTHYNSNRISKPKNAVNYNIAVHKCSTKNQLDILNIF